MTSLASAMHLSASDTEPAGRTAAGNGSLTAAGHAGPRKLAGATVLQIFPALRDELSVYEALNVADALLRVGARAIVAADSGPLVPELRAMGVEWIQFNSASASRWALRRNANTLADIIAAERIDIVHAQSATAAASAVAAAEKSPVWLVTSLPDEPMEPSRRNKRQAVALARGHRVVATSSWAAEPLRNRYRITGERFTVVPHAIDTDVFTPSAVSADRVAALHAAWQVQPQERVVLAPGPVNAANGQVELVDAARILLNDGLRDVTFIIPGEGGTSRRDFRDITKRATSQGVGEVFGLGSPRSDRATLLAAADLVVLPCVVPPIDGSLAAEAQAMARPVVASTLGVLPECLLAPPRMPDDLRSGWLVKPGDPIDLARAISAALALDAAAWRAVRTRAWQFAHSTFSPPAVAAATLAVYTSLLESSP